MMVAVPREMLLTFLEEAERDAMAAEHEFGGDHREQHARILTLRAYAGDPVVIVQAAFYLQCGAEAWRNLAFWDGVPG